MIAVYQKELGSYWRGMLGYLFSAFVLIFAGIYTMAYNLSGAYANFAYVLDAISFIYLIAVPILSMRTFAEERRQKTDQLLYALPVSMSGVVLGKYLAMLTVLAAPTLIMALYPLILMQFGSVPLATAYGALAAFFLLGACLLSVGLLISSVTENQVASAVITLVTVLLLYFMKGLSEFVSTEASASLMALCLLVALFAVALYMLCKNPIVALGAAVVGIGALMACYTVNSSAFEGLFASIMAQLSVFDRFYGFVNGVFDLTAVVYYGSIIAVFLFLTVQAMEKRRWSE
ncbi:MAG: ABC transporter permease subunit [Clostridia bacterium]|nr:ABC transporter permease subunit [Clostridia bacterium]